MSRSECEHGYQPRVRCPVCYPAAPGPSPGDVLLPADQTPDGRRCKFGCCARCHMVAGCMRADRSVVTGPFSALGGQPYCELCYPIMAAIVHADALVAGKVAAAIRARKG